MKETNTKPLLQCGVCCIALLLVVCIACGMFGSKLLLLNQEADEPVWNNPSKMLLCMTAVVCAFLLIAWKKEGSLSESKLVALLFLLVLMARLCYTMEIGIVTNQHDTSWFGNEEQNNGHTGYMLYLLEEGHLPDFNVIGRSQFYHPPLHHILCAVWLAVQTKLGIAFDVAAENLQILTLFYSMVTLYASYRILKELNISGTPLYASLCLLGFHPTFFLFSGSINNDCLSVMFAFLAVWAAIVWWKRPSFGRIVLLALCIGCSMLAKLATGIIAPAVAFLFLHRLVTTGGGRAKGMLIAQFAVFGVICIPLGIGWQVRNYLLFDVPLTYVPKLSVKADQYLGGYSVSERFFDWKSLSDFAVYPARTGRDGAEYFEHCIPLAALKSALFGEYSVWKSKDTYDVVARVMFRTQLGIVISTLAGMIYGGCKLFISKCRTAFYEEFGFSRVIMAFFGIYWLSMMASYVPFCFEYPHFCSMDFRYIVPTLLTGVVFFSVLYQKLDSWNCRASHWIKGALITLVAVFAVCGVMVYPLYY